MMVLSYRLTDCQKTQNLQNLEVRRRRKVVSHAGRGHGAVSQAPAVIFQRTCSLGVTLMFEPP